MRIQVERMYEDLVWKEFNRLFGLKLLAMQGRHLFPENSKSQSETLNVGVDLASGESWSAETIPVKELEPVYGIEWSSMERHKLNEGAADKPVVIDAEEGVM